MKILTKNLSLLFIFFGIHAVQAQVSFGLKAGSNLAEHSFKEQGTTIDRDAITGFLAGGVLEIGLGERFAVQPEFLFIQKGSELDLPAAGEKLTLSYLDIPVLLKIKFINTDLLNVNVFGGPAFGLALDGEQNIGNQTIDINIGGEDGVKQFELGLNVGGGLGINFGNMGVFGDVRYLFGVSDISETNTREIKNQGLSISAGLMFRIAG